jgi:competence protein ComEC
LALILWVGAERPVLLIAESGGLIGVMTDQGRVLSKAEGDGYAAESWLENDGEVVDQASAHARVGLDQAVLRTTRVTLSGTDVVLVTGKTALAALDGCGGADVLIANTVLQGARPCEVIDLARLRDAGSMAGRAVGGSLVMVSSRDMTGQRLWTMQPLRRWEGELVAELGQ